VFVQFESPNLVCDALDQVLLVHQSHFLLLEPLNFLNLVVHLEELGSVFAELDSPRNEMSVVAAEFIVLVIRLCKRSII